SCFFFFSSRRRHTRFSRDWSSDVCSSDLQHYAFPSGNQMEALEIASGKSLVLSGAGRWCLGFYPRANATAQITDSTGTSNVPIRSEERRVGERATVSVGDVAVSEQGDEDV